MDTKNRMNDSFILGALSGLAGTLGDFAIHHLALFLLKTSTTAQYISQLLFPFEKVNWVRYLYGLGIHFFTGGLVGIILVELYRRYSDQYAYFKAVSLSLIFWITHVVVIPNIINLPNRPYLHRSELEALVDLLAHITYGVCAGAVYRKFSVEG